MKNVILIFTFLSSYISHSEGDEDELFQKSLKECQIQKCNNESEYFSNQPFIYKITYWTCQYDCRYEVMHKTVQQRIKNGESIIQYYGKWPFYRFLGMQEPASVLFSILNGGVHLYFYFKFKNLLNEKNPLRIYYILNCLIGVNAWIWSSVFHTRDLIVTQKLDYYSAFLSIIFGFYTTTIRIFHLYNHKTIVFLLSIFCIGCVYYHISRLETYFDFEYNIIANAIFVVLYCFEWLGFSFYYYRFSDYPYPLEPAKIILLLIFAVSFELFDFPPLFWILDAHSLWHFSTIFISYKNYQFLLKDAQLLYSKTKKKSN